MRSLFLKELESYPVTPHKKIFISRRDADERYRKQILEQEKLSSFFRYVDPEINDKIEDYYISRGYYPVNFEGMSYLDQLNYIKNATHVAGLIGSGFTSLFVAKQGCIVTEILVNKKYNFTYKFLADLVPFKFNRLDLRLLVGAPEKFEEVFKLKTRYIDSLEESYEKYNPNN
jgi:capsular polysaccharide biosynthesis protein